MVGIMILLVFIAGVIWGTVKRVENRESSWYEVSSSIGGTCFLFGFIIGLLLASLLAFEISDYDPRATYYLNGIVVKGGTNWMLVFVTFLIGGGFTGVLITWISAIPLKVFNSLRELSNQDIININSLRKIERKRLIALFWAFFLGIYGAHWFYLKISGLGIFQIVWSIIVISSFSLIDPSNNFLNIVCFSILFLPILASIVFIMCKKEIFFNGRRIIIK